MSRECVKSWSLVTRASSESQARPNGSEPGSATAEPLVDLTDGNKKQEEGQEEEKEKDMEEDKEGEVEDKEEVQEVEEDEEKQVEIEVEVLEDPTEFHECMMAVQVTCQVRRWMAMTWFVMMWCNLVEIPLNGFCVNAKVNCHES